MAQTWEKSDGELKEHLQIKPPARYQVILLNDDFTGMEFVVMILMKIFQKKEEEAFQIMLDIHKKGSGVAGTYSKDIAETKVHLTHTQAREAGYPLRCRLQQA